MANPAIAIEPRLLLCLEKDSQADHAVGQSRRKCADAESNDLRESHQFPISIHNVQQSIFHAQESKWICPYERANRTLTLQPRKRELLLIYPYGAT